jgi:hypothetical protein
MFSGTAQVSHQVCQFFVSSVCLLVRVSMVDKNKATLMVVIKMWVLVSSELKLRAWKWSWRTLRHCSGVCWTDCV